MSKTKLGELVCAVVVAGAAVYAGIQFNKAQETQAENLAYQSWERFLEFSVENPDVAKAYFTYDELKPDQKTQYEQYVDRFLLSAEQILNSEPDDPKWRAALMSEARRHYSYLTSEDFIPKDPIKARISGYCAYDVSVRDLVKSALSYGARSNPAGRFEQMDAACERTPRGEASN